MHCGYRMRSQLYMLVCQNSRINLCETTTGDCWWLCEDYSTVYPSRLYESLRKDYSTVYPSCDDCAGFVTKRPKANNKRAAKPAKPAQPQKRRKL